MWPPGHTVDAVPTSKRRQVIIRVTDSGELSREGVVSDSAAVVSGAVISGLVGLTVVFLQQLFTRRHESKRIQSLRLAEFAASVWAATVRIGEIARSPDVNKPNKGQELSIQDSIDRVNNALAQIELYESGDVLVHAIEMDRHLSALYRGSRARQFSEIEWRDTRASLTRSVREFIIAGRAVLGAPRLEEELARLPMDSALKPEATISH